MSEDIVGQIRDVKGRTWQEAFYIQTKAFLEKNSEHLKEIERLKAEVERLKEGNECLDQMHEKEMARSAFLCEEVNRTTAWGRGLESDLSWARAELLMVKAEVDRLTKQNALATPRHLIASQDIKTLREQIEELKLENSQYEEHHKYGQNVITSLREEVERLTKAGDAFYESEIGYYGEQIIEDMKHGSGELCRNWNAAKEGKQP
mgnify:CR=1 FL=1